MYHTCPRPHTPSFRLNVTLTKLHFSLSRFAKSCGVKGSELLEGWDTPLDKNTKVVATQGEFLDTSGIVHPFRDYWFFNAEKMAFRRVSVILQPYKKLF